MTTALHKTDTIEARKVDFDAIPVIDLGPFLKGELGAKEKVAEEIGRACRHVGFFYIKNHGIPQPMIDELMTQTLRFFQATS